MAKIVRGPQGTFLRDDRGKYTAISYTTKGGDVVWVSNKLFALVFGFVLLLMGLTGSVDTSLAKAFDVALRLVTLS